MEEPKAMISATHWRFNTGNVFPLFVTLSVIKSVSLGAGLAGAWYPYL